jgi:hypothetical protein
VPELGHGCADGLPLDIGRLNMAGAPVHSEPSWWYVEAHKPTAYMPHLQIGVEIAFGFHHLRLCCGAELKTEKREGVFPFLPLIRPQRSEYLGLPCLP